MDLLGPIIQTLSDIGALGVAGIVIWAMVTERLVPKGRLDDKQKELDDCKEEMHLERARYETPPERR
jgi:hypothetical protein